MSGSQVMFFNEVGNHFSRRFAAFAFIFRRVGANGKIFEGFQLMGPQIVLQLAMDNINIFQTKVSTTNARLVSDNKKFVAQVLKQVKGLKSIRKKLDIFDFR
jgi:hypothetical protein